MTFGSEVSGIGRLYFILNFIVTNFGEVRTFGLSHCIPPGLACLHQADLQLHQTFFMVLGLTLLKSDSIQHLEMVLFAIFLCPSNVVFVF